MTRTTSAAVWKSEPCTTSAACGRSRGSAAVPHVIQSAVLCPHLVEVPHAVAAAAPELVGAVEGLLQQGKGPGTLDTTKKVLSGVSGCMGVFHTCVDVFAKQRSQRDFVQQWMHP